MQKKLTRGLVLVAIATVLFAGLAMGEANTKNATAAPTASVAKTATNVDDTNRTTYTFLQEGSNGTFVKDGSGNYTLTITGVIPYTIYFSDRPARDAGFVPMDQFLKGFCFGGHNPPNAALILRGEAADHDMIVVELTSPKYNDVNKTLTYTAKVVDKYAFKSNWTQDLMPRVDHAIPEKFGRIAVVIDDCADMYVTCKKGEAQWDECGIVSAGCCWEYIGCYACHDHTEDCREQYGDECASIIDDHCVHP